MTPRAPRRGRLSNSLFHVAFQAAALSAAILIAAAEGAAQAPPQQDAPSIEIPRVTTDAAVDGVLDEPVWQQAALLDHFHQYEPVDSRPAQQQTEVRVWYAPDAIWFGIIAHDDHPQGVRATKADRDNIDGEDNVVIYLDTFDDRRRAFFFGVNPLGVQTDGVRTEGAASAGHIFGGNIDKSPDYWFDSAGHLTDDGYVVEVRIPFKSLRYPGNGSQRWGLQIVRKVQRTGYTDTWTDVRRASASFLAQAGTVEGLHDLHRGIVIEAQPFVTAGLNGSRAASDAPFRRGHIEPDAGLNLRLGLTNLSLDATLNPDFSQVEADVGQVTANERFALFYPEKRPFFLEGIELFATPNQLVYTRQIVDPAGGAKITGKLGSLGIAYLSALDQAGDRDALFNVLRLRRDLGSNSLAGLVFTDRSVQGTGAYNRVLAADTRLVFARLYYFEAQVGGSWTRIGGPLPGRPSAFVPYESRNAPIWKAEVDRTGRSFGFNYQLNAIGDGFESDAGYVPRTGIVTAHGFNRLTLYGPPGAAVENFTTFFGPTRIWRYGGFGHEAAVEGSESLTGMLNFRGGWLLQGNVTRNFYRLDAADYAGYTVAGPGGATPFEPLDRVSGPDFSLQLNTPTFQGFDASVHADRGRFPIFDEGGEGDATTASASLALRPTRWARLTLSGTWRRIDRTRDGSRFSLSRIPRLKAEVQPSRPLFFRAIAEWRSEQRAALEDPFTGTPLAVDGSYELAQDADGLRLDLLVSYEPVPGTVAFLGYGSSLAGRQFLRWDGLERQTDGFFVKLAYQFRR